MDICQRVRERHQPHPGERCPACNGTGHWETECCSGAGGCSCGGQTIDMGACNVCGGAGIEPEDADPAANLAAIMGYGFIGSGPTSSSIYNNTPRMGLR